MGRITDVSGATRRRLDTRMDVTDLSRYLAVMVFGPNPDPFHRYVNRAYRDLSRTLHTTDTGRPRQERVDLCHERMVSTLVLAKTSGRPALSQDDFDAWHAESCEALIAEWGPADMSYGHAQKWVNMSLKYLFTAHGLELEDIGPIAACYRYAHIPIDRVVVAALYDDGFAHWPRPVTWSDLTREAYLDFQMAVRAAYEDCPMDVEFMLWRGGGKRPLKA